MKLHDDLSKYWLISSARPGHDGEALVIGDRLDAATNRPPRRRLEWSLDPDPTDTTSEVHDSVLVREGGKVRSFHDMHLEGLFPRATCFEIVRSTGFTPEEGGVDEWRRDLIVARKTT